jgi:hypothetical protein
MIEIYQFQVDQLSVVMVHKHEKMKVVEFANAVDVGQPSVMVSELEKVEFLSADGDAIDVDQSLVTANELEKMVVVEFSNVDGGVIEVG